MLVESRHTGQLYVFKVLHKSLKQLAAQPRGKSKVTKNRSPVREREGEKAGTEREGGGREERREKGRRRERGEEV
jgi:hypothetical protein